MGQQLSPEYQELYRRVDEVLHYLWDPIGISSHPEARDEYHSYLPTVFSLLTKANSIQDIADFLDTASTQRMGLPDTQRGREHSYKIAVLLKSWRDFIRQRHANKAPSNQDADLNPEF